MNNIYFSKSTFGFYKSDLYTNKLPIDSVEITDEIWQSMLQGQSLGKIISADESGHPVLKDPPLPTQESVIFQTTIKKSNLISEAAIAMMPLQDAVDLDVATDDELAKLKLWKEYRVALNRLDITQAPDITWPVSPDI
ncbi:tail fiber assembly protein [Rouxiella sp. Mn2063]|uniref:tail fiber assembly protein n=1 Tax=Rouxiella sp. Mn2063 TaxID=3395262 RepID=UPI003BE8ED84